jgi:hypothetical protein
MENDTRCTCNPMDSEIYCPIHTTTEDYIQKYTAAIGYLVSLEKKEDEAFVETCKQVAREKMAKGELPTELDMTHIRNLKESEKNANEEKIMELALGGPKGPVTNLYKAPVQEDIFSQSEKYYTLSIKDIRVGYECEVWVEYWNDEYKGNEWKSWTVSHQDIQYGDSKGVTVIGLLYPHFSEPRIRTPYLTKEQIEAEGWEVKETHWSGSNFSFEKGNYGGVQLRDGRVAIIMLDVTLDDYTCNTSNGQLYLGKCPSINEFRFINKLLGI